MIDWDTLGEGTVVELQNTIYSVAEVVERVQRRIALGTWDGTLLEVLEEIEGILR